MANDDIMTPLGVATDPVLAAFWRRKLMAEALARKDKQPGRMTHWLQPLGYIANEAVDQWNASKAEKAFQEKLDAYNEEIRKQGAGLDAILNGIFPPGVGNIGPAGNPPMQQPQPSSSASPTPSVPPGMTKPQSTSYTPEQSLDLGARTIATEGPKDDIEAIAMANVIRNRARAGKPEWGDNYGSVVTADRQFSSWNKEDVGAPNDPRNVDINSSKYRNTLAAMQLVDRGLVGDKTDGALNFARPASSTNKDWLPNAMAGPPENRTQIGNHYYFRGVDNGIPGQMAAQAQAPAAPQGSPMAPPTDPNSSGQTWDSRDIQAWVTRFLATSPLANDPRILKKAKAIIDMAKLSDTEWGEMNVGGRVILYDKRRPSRRIDMGEHTSPAPGVMSPEAFEQQKELKAVTNVINNISQGPNEAAKLIAERWIKTVQPEAAESYSRMRDYDRALGLLDKFQSGPLAGSRVWVGQLASEMGIPTKGTAEGEQLLAIQRRLELALTPRGQGQITESERKLVREQINFFLASPGGARSILEYARAKDKERIDVARIYAASAEKGGGAPNPVEIQKGLEDYYTKMPPLPTLDEFVTSHGWQANPSSNEGSPKRLRWNTEKGVWE